VRVPQRITHRRFVFFSFAPLRKPETSTIGRDGEAGRIEHCALPIAFYFLAQATPGRSIACLVDMSPFFSTSIVHPIMENWRCSAGFARFLSFWIFFGQG